MLQTKKDGALFTGKKNDDTEVMIVSGQVYYDAFGRAIKSLYPVTESKGHTGLLNRTADNIAPTRVTYDVMDRNLTTTLPDGSVTKTSYGFDKDRAGKLQFLTTVTDANGKVSETFTDVRGRQTAVKAPGDTWTSFVYDPIGQLVAATDPENNTTTSLYDMLGRRLSRKHPDAGVTEYTYDLAGNMTAQVTANLKAAGKEVKYEYDFNRLTAIKYPLNTFNDVRFVYGKAGDKYNRAGRISVQEDATGAQEFFYGPLGEITKNIRTIVVPGDEVYTFTTQWEYDTWNRLTGMTYPDGEKLKYTYNTGGQLKSMKGEKTGQSYNYLTRMGYDKFENRVYLSYGNGTETSYSYEPERRRLEHITATTSKGRKMMENTYTYDKVDNIMGIINEAPIPSINRHGGPSSYSYQYDDLYRLTYAGGKWEGSTSSSRFTMKMAYSPTGRILEKKQTHDRMSYEEPGVWIPQHKTTYDLDYRYESSQPHAATHIGENTYTYDANGNQTGWTNDNNGTRRGILWDEENRIRAIADNGVTHHYIYDASGERVIKSNGDGQAIYVNGFPMGGSGTVGNYTMYVNPFLVVQNSKYTKHFYIEGQRIVSKLGAQSEAQFVKSAHAGDSIATPVQWDKKKERSKDIIIANFEALGLDGAVFTAGKSGKMPYGQIKKYLNSGGSVINPGGGSRPSRYVDENLQFYYHPDHLGSSNYITNASGEVYQHQEYFPFGETFVEERNSAEYTTYLFNGKELDEETGLYYYGARYYDPRISIWTTIDSKTEKHLNLSPFVYCSDNPILLKDPDGKDWIVSTKVADGNTQINLTFVGAIMNSSGKQIDMQKLMTNEVKKFESVFGQGNVHATMLLREIKSKDDIRWNESLIEIKDGNNFSSKEGGNTYLGGKYISLNADYIDKNGNFSDKKTLMHEIGHTGGLVHPWEFSKKHSFINGNQAPTNNQSYYNSANSLELESNFMNYSSKAVENYYNPFSTKDFVKYFNDNIGKATQGQEQQIINNLYNGNLNYDDIPKK